MDLLIDTDILVDHLINDKDELSILEKAMSSHICFTTVINASELFFAVGDQRKEADMLLRSLKVLGLHARYSLSISEFTGKVDSVRDAMICSAAKINKLSVLTLNKTRYQKSGLKLIHPQNL